jgi:hypothetical protein
MTRGKGKPLNRAQGTCACIRSEALTRYTLLPLFFTFSASRRAGNWHFMWHTSITIFSELPSLMWSLFLRNVIAMVTDISRSRLTPSRHKKHRRGPSTLTFVVWFLFQCPYQHRLQATRERLSLRASVKVLFMVAEAFSSDEEGAKAKSDLFGPYQLFKFDQKPVREWKWSTMIAEEFWRAFSFRFWSGLTSGHRCTVEILSWATLRRE